MEEDTWCSDGDVDADADVDVDPFRDGEILDRIREFNFGVALPKTRLAIF